MLESTGIGETSAEIWTVIAAIVSVQWWNRGGYDSDWRTQSVEQDDWAIGKQNPMISLWFEYVWMVMENADVHSFRSNSQIGIFIC